MSLSQQPHDLTLFEYAGGGFCVLVDTIDAALARFQAAFLKPVDDVRFTTHWTNLDHLFKTKLARRHTRVNNIRQPRIAFLITLNDRGCMNTGRGPKRIPAKNRVVERHTPTACARGGLAVFTQTRQIVIDPTE